MRLLFNRYRLTTTLELGCEELCPDPILLERRCVKRYERLRRQGQIEDFLFLGAELFAAFGRQGPPQTQRHLLAVGLPRLTGFTIAPRTLSDMLRGIIARVEVAQDAMALDPRLYLGVTAQIARRVGTPFAGVDANDTERLLQRVQASRQEAVTGVIHTLRHRRILHSLPGGDLLELRHGGGLALGIQQPEMFMDQTYAQVFAGQLKELLLEPQWNLTRTEVDVLLFNYELCVRGVRLSTRLQPQGYGAVWSLTMQTRPAGASARQRLFKLPVHVIDQGMTALVSGPLVCEDLGHEGSPSLAEFQAAVAQTKVVGVTVDALLHLHAEVLEGRSIVGRVLAQATTPVADQSPMLRAATLGERYQPVLSRDFAEPEARLPKKFVAAEELVAVVDYREAGRNGRDVYGNVLARPPAAADGFTAGDGVVRKGDCFFATAPGSLTLTATAVSVQPATIISGDIGPSEGRLLISGPLEIQGGVEAGTWIEASGAVKIDQSFAGSYLRADGNVEIKGGIVGSDNKTLVIKGDLKCRFIQSGRIRCLGDVVIESHMSGGSVEADGKVTVLSPQGGIFGGNVVAGGSIEAANLGRARAQRPRVWFGTSARSWRRLRILEHRQKALMAAKEALLRLGLQRPSMPRQRAAVAGARHGAMDKMQRLDTLLSKIGAQIAAARAAISATPGGAVAVAPAAVTAAGTVQSEVTLCHANSCIVVDKAVAAVAVTSDDDRLIIQPLQEAAKAGK